MRGAQRVVRLVGGDDGHRLADEIGQLAAEHAPRRTVHPLDAGIPDGDDADQHRIQDRAGAFGLQLQRLAHLAPLVHIDIGADQAGTGLLRVHQPLAHLHPTQVTIAAAQPALTAESAGLGQGDVLLVGQCCELLGALEQVGQRQLLQLGHRVTRQPRQCGVSALDPAAADMGDADLGQAEHQLALTHHRLQLKLLGLEVRNIGQHRDDLDLVIGQAAGQRQRQPG